ncbi:GNAT family N-acetyltransferase [Aspergillus mulundensis]|uniref:N-acetyltransferase domain-containing protein n=1 Tax=Aspergillus mulundensis TaxID=1810919 RepID=A0A3D8T2I9_9EURO|nr:Uncharacterized protein DSM5745_00051 [Aspergillus mulundensis]RDW92729.1 Uncharacterized protein DSM5745_00051 [Aspergillus mulundensis]
MPSQTSVEIQPFEKTDIREAVLLGQVAFAETNRLAYTGPLSPSSIDAMVAQREASADTEPHVTTFKAVDVSTGKMVGLARWAIWETDQVVEKSVDEVVRDRLSAPVAERRDEVARAMWTLVQVGKREILGVGKIEGNEKGIKLRKRIELEALCVHPDYQGRGIAKRFLAWGVGEAEMLGLDVYLEATEAGRPVYEKTGFQAVRKEEFGLDGIGETSLTFMILPAKAVSEVKDEL